MGNDFRTALMYQLDKHQTKIADLVRETGVSRDVINKLKAQDGGNKTTSVENGLLIAAYYGKTLNQFVAMNDATDDTAINALLELLSPEEKRLLKAQIRGLIFQRDQK